MGLTSPPTAPEMCGGAVEGVTLALSPLGQVVAASATVRKAVENQEIEMIAVAPSACPVTAVPRVFVLKMSTGVRT